MNYCINPECKQRQNIDNLEYCQSCGTPLLINARYQLIKPLRQLDLRNPTDIFEVDDRGTRKVMKVLKDNSTKLIDLLEQEANVLQWLKHPGIPKVEIDGYFTFLPSNSTQEIHCLVMEKIDGDNLEQWLEKHGSISQKLALNWLKQIIEILSFVHQEGFFHRDIKPSNIMLRPNGKLALIDFGSVREITNTYLVKISGGSGERIGADITGIISTGYTPLEQVNGRAVPQSDFYALGRTFVRLLTGKSLTDLPINSETGRIIWRKQAPQVSKPLADFIDDLMAPFPGERPQNTQVILQRLSASGMVIQTILRLISYHSILRLINYPRFQFGVVVLLLIGLIYRLSFPLIGQYYYERGVEDQKAERLDDAKRNYEQALKFSPRDARIYNNLGLLCQTQNDSGCAKTYYEEALNLNPDNPVARYNLGGLYDDLGDFNRASYQYQLALQSENPVAANAFSNLARLKNLEGDSTAAIKSTSQGLQRAGKEKVKSALYKNRGWARWMQTDYEEAETDLRQAINLNPEQADAYCLLAQVLEAKSEKKGALAVWKDCLHYGSRGGVEVKFWKNMAIQRLKDAGEKK